MNKHNHDDTDAIAPSLKYDDPANNVPEDTLEDIPPYDPTVYMPPPKKPGRPYNGGYQQPQDGKLSTSNKEAIIRLIDYLIDNLSFKRIALLAILGFCSLVLYATYENREAIAQNVLSYIVAGSVDRTTNNIVGWALSDVSKKDIEQFSNIHPIVFTAVTEVNLKNNSRQIHYTYIKPDLLVGLNRAKILTDAKSAYTIFDYDPRNTTQMVSVLANEFRCDPFIDTLYYKVMPEGNNRITTICRIAIPPFIGKFIGYISVGISKQPTTQEQNSIRLGLSKMAIDIYLRDIEKKPQ